MLKKEITINYVNILNFNGGNYLLGCKVGTCWANLSSLSMCNNVVLPALSKPRNNNLPDFFQRPVQILIEINKLQE